MVVAVRSPRTGGPAPAALTEAILTLAQTPVETLTAMGEAARTRVFARHNIDTEAAKLAALFAQYKGV